MAKLEERVEILKERMQRIRIRKPQLPKFAKRFIDRHEKKRTIQYLIRAKDDVERLEILAPKKAKTKDTVKPGTGSHKTKEAQENAEKTEVPNEVTAGQSISRLREKVESIKPGSESFREDVKDAKAALYFARMTCTGEFNAQNAEKAETLANAESGIEYFSGKPLSSFSFANWKRGAINGLCLSTTAMICLLFEMVQTKSVMESLGIGAMSQSEGLGEVISAVAVSAALFVITTIAVKLSLDARMKKESERSITEKTQIKTVKAQQRVFRLIEHAKKHIEKIG